MTEPGCVVVVGAGLAGASAAAELRAAGFTGDVVLFGRETHRPYELPALSKGLLLGDTDEPDWVREPGFYAEAGVDWRPGVEITQVNLADRLVRDTAGRAQRYDRLLLATGSRPRTLPVPGADLVGLHTLRTLDDALRLRSALAADHKVVVVGGGWIGCEVAAAARRHRAEVTVVVPERLPLLRVLGETVAAVFRDVHAAHGVSWRLGVGVAGFVGNTQGAVTAVRLSDGDELPADLVVLGVGARPDLDLAESAGLALTGDVSGGGVAVSADLRTSVPEVFAVGDIAAHDHPGYGRRVRVEHWANAKDQGTCVAANLLGAATPYRASPYFFSDQYELTDTEPGIGMEYRGLADPERDELVVRGELGEPRFIAFWLRRGRVRAAMNVNVWDAGEVLRAVVDRQVPADARHLRTGDLAALVG